MSFKHQTDAWCLTILLSIKITPKTLNWLKKQYSENAHSLIRGIAVVNCLYINPDNGNYWVVDYGIFNPDGDGKSKFDHVREMLLGVVCNKNMAFNRVLFDSWHATKNLMLLIESLGNIYYCPPKNNRQIDDSDGLRPYVRVYDLYWSAHECRNGKIIKIKGFPKDHKVKLFRVEVSTSRTDWVVSNDLNQNSTQGVQDVCALRWKIEQFHRELKQLTGVEFREIISPVLCWFGRDLPQLPDKHAQQSIKSKIKYSHTIYVRNCAVLVGGV